LNEEADPKKPAYDDASPFQPKQKAPLLERIRAAVEAAV